MGFKITCDADDCDTEAEVSPGGAGSSFSPPPGWRTIIAAAAVTAPASGGGVGVPPPPGSMPPGAVYVHATRYIICDKHDLPAMTAGRGELVGAYPHAAPPPQPRKPVRH